MELKPCPFCGGEAQARRNMVGYWLVVCDTPYCSSIGGYNTEAEAIAAWNTRAERTCKNINGENWWAFECSECGEMIEQGVPEYCPECGAKVVE